MPNPRGEALVSVSFRMRQSLVDRLEAAKWAMKMPKVQVVEKALEELYEKYDVPEGEE